MYKNKYYKYIEKNDNNSIQKGGYNPKILFINSYLQFFDKKIKAYNYIKNQYGFNMSVCKLDDTSELYCIRYLGTIPAYFGEDIIPGNFSGYSKTYIQTKIDEEKKRNITNKFINSLKIGKNFFWNSWNSTLLDNSIFFVGSYNNGVIDVNYEIEPYVISNKFALTNINHDMLKYNDVRIIKIKKKNYCYDSLISSIYEIKIINNKIYIPLFMDEPIYTTEFFYFKNKLCAGLETYLKKFDKNWSLVDIIQQNDINYFEFINWFENKHVTNTLINMKTGDGIKNNIILMEGDIIDGLGNANLPMFSFGTPFLKIESTDENIYYTGIAAGHSKIIITKTYDNENIMKFINNIYEKYGKLNNFIQHNSYIYMIYYIKFIKYKNNTYDMFISDSYLYIDINQQYLFSICFPMGVITKNDKYIISYGYGDYYNYMVEYDKNKLLKKIKHNVRHFDIKKYKFKIIEN
jgi:hypothetical protein